MVFDGKTLLNESMNFDFGKNIHSENVRWYADYEEQPRNLDGEWEFILKLIEIGRQIIVGSLLKKFDGISKRMKKILKILLKPY